MIGHNCADGQETAVETKVVAREGAPWTSRRYAVAEEGVMSMVWPNTASTWGSGELGNEDEEEEEAVVVVGVDDDAAAVSLVREDVEEEVRVLKWEVEKE